MNTTIFISLWFAVCYFGIGWARDYHKTLHDYVSGDCIQTKKDEALEDWEEHVANRYLVKDVGKKKYQLLRLGSLDIETTREFYGIDLLYEKIDCPKFEKK